MRRWLPLLIAVPFLCPALGAAQTRAKLRVCADPQNMPFSNEKMEGLENRIADLIAKDFGADLTYTWWGQRRGFIRNTMSATLESGRCDVVLGVPEKYDLVRTTTPYYRSTYVFVYPKSRKLGIRTLDDPRLKKLKIGVHLLGDDYTNPPPVHELSKRGVIDNVIGFPTFYSEANQPGTIIEAVAQGKIDLAIVWGPIGGYYARRTAVPMDVVAIPSGKGDLPFAYDISMGVKPGNEALRTRLQGVIDRRQAELTQILRDYGVPLLDRTASPNK